MNRVLLCALVGVVAWPAPAPAQSVVPDSASGASLVLALTRGIFPALSEALSWDVASATVAPWTIVVRDSANPRWRRVQQGLRLTLPSAPSRSAEHYRHHLVIHKAEVRGDSTVMRLDVVLSWSPKPDCRIQSSMSFELRSTREDGRWRDAVARPDMDGLPGVCP